MAWEEQFPLVLALLDQQVVNHQSTPVALLVDPDPTSSRLLAEALLQLGFHPLKTVSGAESLDRFHGQLPCLILLDLDLGDMPGLQLLRHFRSHASKVPIIALSRKVDVRTAVEVVRAGATEVIGKSSNRESLRQAIQKVLPQVRAAGRRETPDRARALFFSQYEGLFRRSGKMTAVEALVMRVADTDSPVLVQGEPGTGKELVSKAIHYLSGRSGKPWQRVNCTSMPADLLEIEIFGHEPPNGPGRQPGKLELAEGGTLLLDEIGDLPATVQPRIVHVLQDGQFFRAGGHELIGADVRIIATTTRDLKAMAVDSAFREDLQRLIGVVSIVVPPLRERREEIPSLADDFRSRFATDFGRPEPRLAGDLLDLLRDYDWPGNVRELENLIKRWVVLGDEAHLRDELSSRIRARGSNGIPSARLAPGVGLREIGRRAARAAEQEALREALERVGGNRAAAARLLKVSYKTLLQKLAEKERGNDRADRPDGQRR